MSIHYIANERKSHLDIPQVGALARQRMEEQKIKKSGLQQAPGTTRQGINYQSKIGTGASQATLHKKSRSQPVLQPMLLPVKTSSKNGCPSNDKPNSPKAYMPPSVTYGRKNEKASMLLARTKIKNDTMFPQQDQRCQQKMKRNGGVLFKPPPVQASPRSSIQAAASSLNQHLRNMQKAGLHSKNKVRPRHLHRSTSNSTSSAASDDVIAPYVTPTIKMPGIQVEDLHHSSSATDEYFQQGSLNGGGSRAQDGGGFPNIMNQRDEESFRSRQNSGPSEQKQEEAGNKDANKSLDEIIDDNFNFIKFLNDVRVRYNLSPTPLIEEDDFAPIDKGEQK